MHRSKLYIILPIAVALFLIAYLLVQRKNDTNHSVPLFSRTIIDSVDVEKNSWQHLPDNAVGVITGPLSYLLSGYHNHQLDGQGSSEVTCLPVENAYILLTAASYKQTRHYVYRTINTWFRKSKKDQGIQKTTFLGFSPCSGLLLDSTKLLIVEADTLQNKLNLSIIDTSANHLKSLEVKLSPEACHALSEGATALILDNSYYLVAQYYPLAIVIDPQSGRTKQYSLRPSKKQIDFSVKSNPNHLKQNLLAKYHFGHKMLYILNSQPDKKTPRPPAYYTSYLDFYNKAFVYQYSLAIKNLNPGECQMNCVSSFFNIFAESSETEGGSAAVQPTKG